MPYFSQPSLPITLAVALVATASAAPKLPFGRSSRDNTPKHDRAKAIAYAASVESCKNGQTGTLVTFRGSAAQRTPIVRRAGDAVTRTFANIPLVSATLTKDTLRELLDDDGVTAVEADCIIVLDEPSPDLADDVSPTSLPWGIDRIDSRNGRDGTYNYGTATGAQARVYVLDTGIRTSHTDFGGRAVAGWSYGCQTGSESACGSNWACARPSLSRDLLRK